MKTNLSIILLHQLVDFLQKHSNHKIPVVGICYGMHILTKFFKGEVISSSRHIKTRKTLNERQFYLNYHDFVLCAPGPFMVEQEDEQNGHILKMAWKNLDWVALQYHPEGTFDGHDWLRKFCSERL